MIADAKEEMTASGVSSLEHIPAPEGRVKDMIVQQMTWGGFRLKVNPAKTNLAGHKK